MLPPVVLREDGFDLEFHTLTDLAGGGRWGDLLGSDGYLLQERLIVPPDLVGDAGREVAWPPGPPDCNPSLVWIGHPALPLQRAAVVARPRAGGARIEVSPAAVKIAADGVQLLFSAPLLCSAERSPQALDASFRKVSTVLAAGGMEESALARTWLFLDDILGGYGLLNEARQRYFQGWFSSANRFVPASTGIQARMPGGHRLSVEFWAFAGEGVTIRTLRSPLQDEPTGYGKLFSRAVRVDLPANSLLLVSGTAAIDQAGASLHGGDFAGQLHRTLEVIAALLAEAGGDFSTVAQGIVYLKRAEDLELCRLLLAAAGFPGERALFQVETPVCREELWCEIEVTAVLPRPAGSAARLASPGQP